MNIHQVILRLLTGLTGGALIEQTYSFARIINPINPRYWFEYFGAWFYGFDIPSFFGTYHVQGSYPAISVLAICVVCLKLLKK